MTAPRPLRNPLNRTEVTPRFKAPKLKRRKKGLRAMSDKRIASIPTRREVREQALERANWRCEAKYVVPEVHCGFYGGRGYEVDEIIPRSAYPGGELDIDNVQVLCPSHHDWKTNNPREAVERGLRKWSHDRRKK